MAETTEQTARKHVCEAILTIAEHGLNDDVIRSLVGGEVATTHEQVADAFGRSSNTISNSWVSGGMPGAGVAGKGGKYPLADILLWRLSKIAPKRRHESATDSEIKRRLAEEELRKLSAQADRIEREEQEAIGNLIQRRDAVAGIKALLAALAEHFMGLPDKLAPALPTESATELVETMRSDIERHITHFREQSARELIKNCGPGPEECTCRL